MPELAQILAALAAAPGRPAVLATLVQVEGSSYRRPGARLLLLADGTHLGSISGGCLEEDVVQRAGRVLASGRPECATYDTTAENDLVWGVGLGCQGVVRIFIEPLPAARPRWVGALSENLRARRATTLAVVHGEANGAARGTCVAGELPGEPADAGIFRETVSAPPPLVIFGAGDDAQPLVRLAKETGWHVTVVDARPAYATAMRFPRADAVVTVSRWDVGEFLAPGEETFAVVMTHRYTDDLQFLRALLPQPLAYLGVLGPRKRTNRLLAQLQEEGLAAGPEVLARLHAPVGLDLGGDTPAAVALAILAEMHSRLSGRAPVNLRDRPGSIHGR
ncbi:XdhC/CoxI family protein [Opitutus sp. GAS368]|uniref:XdhC family protein n=1 Tax=Opitutus sp. GAS368 TaxID=1882749 RepID=UPI00087CB2DB|nr:XdhC/CoxI family protein [Opitutus sp. GAS368]SDS19617.1 Xanthine and CO dehydrogenase maturation factor, XdhC/CoxF family [Opitutus sp. GAS368]